MNAEVELPWIYTETTERQRLVLVSFALFSCSLLFVILALFFSVVSASVRINPRPSVCALSVWVCPGTRYLHLRAYRIRMSAQIPIAHNRMYTSVNATQNRLAHAQFMWPRLRRLTQS